MFIKTFSLIILILKTFIISSKDGLLIFLSFKSSYLTLI